MESHENGNHGCSVAPYFKSNSILLEICDSQNLAKLGVSAHSINILWAREGWHKGENVHVDREQSLTLSFVLLVVSQPLFFLLCLICITIRS